MLFDCNNDFLNLSYRIYACVVLVFSSRWYECLIIVHRKWH